MASDCHTKLAWATFSFSTGNNLLTLEFADIAKDSVDENWICRAIQSRKDFSFDIIGDIVEEYLFHFHTLVDF
jgi:hypothetical protein